MIKLCTVQRCELWPYRFGLDPSPSRTRGFKKATCSRGPDDSKLPSRAEVRP